jgi:hypothetical protein
VVLWFDFFKSFFTNVWECGWGFIFKKFKIFYFFIKIKYNLYVLDRFDVLISKIIFKKWKNIIDMHFNTKSYLKSTRNHTVKHTSNLLSWPNTIAQQAAYFRLPGTPKRLYYNAVVQEFGAVLKVGIFEPLQHWCQHTFILL